MASVSIGDRIAALRSKHHMSQKDLADFLYVNQGTVSRWEKGIRFPDDDLIIRMAERFGIDPEELMSPPPAPPVIILVDDEDIALEINIPMMQEHLPDAEIYGFSKGSQAIALAREKHIDIAFLDIELFRENGVDLAQKLIALYPEINIIFLTGHPDFMKDAFDMHASGYILKPMSDEDFLKELSHLRYPVDGLAVQQP